MFARRSASAPVRRRRSVRRNLERSDCSSAMPQADRDRGKCVVLVGGTIPTVQVRIFAVLLTSTVVWQQPQLCSGEQTNVFGTNSREDSSQRSELNGNCHGGNNILFNGSCYPEFTKGHPCGDDQWLVRSTLAPASSNSICQKRPCGETQYLWTIDSNRPRICEEDGYGRRLKCPLDEAGFIDKNEGIGRCDCIDGSVFWKPTDTCYALFSKGPCEEGEILYYNPEDKFLSCQTNPCDQAGKTLWEDGECYPLRDPSKTPCPKKNDHLNYLAINSITLEVECTAVVYKQFTVVDAFFRDYENQQAGVSFSRYPTSATKDYTRSDSRGCPKGMSRIPQGGCTPWKKAHRSASAAVGSSVTTLEMSSTATTEETAFRMDMLTNSLPVGEPTSSEASFPNKGLGVSVASQLVLPLILVSVCAAVTSIKILL